MAWWKTAKPGDEITLVQALSPLDIHPTALSHMLNSGSGIPKFGQVYILDGFEPYGNEEYIKVVGFYGKCDPKRWRPVEYNTDDTYLEETADASSKQPCLV